MDEMTVVFLIQDKFTFQLKSFSVVEKKFFAENFVKLSEKKIFLNFNIKMVIIE